MRSRLHPNVRALKQFNLCVTHSRDTECVALTESVKVHDRSVPFFVYFGELKQAKRPCPRLAAFQMNHELEMIARFNFNVATRFLWHYYVRRDSLVQTAHSCQSITPKYEIIRVNETKRAARTFRQFIDLTVDKV